MKDEEKLSPEDTDEALAALTSTLSPSLQTLVAFLTSLGGTCLDRQEKAHHDSTNHGGYDASSPSPNTKAAASSPSEGDSAEVLGTSSLLTASELSSLTLRVSSLSSSLLPPSFLSSHSTSLIAAAPCVISLHQLNPLLASLHSLVKEGSNLDIPNEALRFFGYSNLQAANDDPKYQFNMSSFVANMTEFKDLSAKTERSLQVRRR